MQDPQNSPETTAIQLQDIAIRTTLQPGDLGYIIYLHGSIYGKEYKFGVSFETYVAEGLCEFYGQFDPLRDKVWICEHNDRIIGFLLLMHRPGNIAQLRYFLLLAEYRGIGLGKKLMDSFMAHLRISGFKGAYLWTTNEQETAVALYKRYGFRLTEEKSSDTFGKRLIELKYELNSGN